jgi:ATP-dependent helicase HrpA
MTDGVLLVEAQSDRMLRRYDTLIVDEAHERSLNIDFVLGILRSLLPRRPDLKVVITSATLDTEKFARAFQGAPVIEVSGRMYPVEVRWRPPDSEGEEGGEDAYVEAAVAAVEDIRRERLPGDTLIFMPTEQDIMETCELLSGRWGDETAILPLFARLPIGEQRRVFQTAHRPKIIVATNVAETSLTIPNIRYVIDTGLARIAQYNPRSRTAGLPVRPISQSSADQRKGRCGRVREGVCIRLYSQEDFQARPLYTPPEILRSNLAGVILQMLYLRLGDMAQFPFIDQPAKKNIADALEILVELGAVRKAGKDDERTPTHPYHQTEQGRVMARLPLDPRIARMMIEGRRRGCLRETAVIASALAVSDPREPPRTERPRRTRPMPSTGTTPRISTPSFACGRPTPKRRRPSPARTACANTVRANTCPTNECGNGGTCTARFSRSWRRKRPIRGRPRPRHPWRA